NPAIRPYLDKYMRGSNGYSAVDRVKLLKLMWDAVGTEFAGRHELYEINYGGSTEENRRYVLFGAQALGTADKLKGFGEQCRAGCALDGWKAPALPTRGEPSSHANGRAAPPAPVTPLASAQPDARPADAGSPVLGGEGPGFRNPYASSK